MNNNRVRPQTIEIPENNIATPNTDQHLNTGSPAGFLLDPQSPNTSLRSPYASCLSGIAMRISGFISRITQRISDNRNEINQSR